MRFAVWILISSFAASALASAHEEEGDSESNLIAARHRGDAWDNDKDTLFDENRRMLRKEARDRARQEWCQEYYYYYPYDYSSPEMQSQQYYYQYWIPQ